MSAIENGRRTVRVSGMRSGTQSTRRSMMSRVEPLGTMGGSGIGVVPLERREAFVGGRNGDVSDGGQAQIALGSAHEATTVADGVAALRAERDALQQRIDDCSQCLENLTQTRDEYIASVSHELKSPLTSILGGAQYIERLLRAPAPDVGKAVAWARVIQDHVRVMMLVIDDLLDASRIQSGAFDLRVAPRDINECVAVAVERLGPDATARVTVIPSSIPATGCWDRQRLLQVLANLLDNALKYSPGGEPVSVVVEAGADEVVVSVRDRGVGVPPAELPRLFERFYRTASASVTGILGTGLGLFICDRIIRAHGGRLWAESAGVGMGSVFRFTLPLSPPRSIGTMHSEDQTK